MENEKFVLLIMTREAQGFLSTVYNFDTEYEAMSRWHEECTAKRVSSVVREYCVEILNIQGSIVIREHINKDDINVIEGN